MYENKTYDLILTGMLDRIKGQGVDTSEGSFLYSAIAPAAWELAEAYLEMDTIYNNTFADTAPREELILRAKERGLSPKSATNAVLKGIINCDIPIGSRFSLNDLNYIANERISFGIFKFKCEKAGVDGNKKFGELIPIQYIPEFKNADLVELLIPGEDEEDTDLFRARYFNSFNSLAFGGNKADYIEKVKSLSGIGGVKVERINRDDSNIRIQIINSEYGVPSNELIQFIQTIIDPTLDGEGTGLAPIGHVVVVEGAVSTLVDIDTVITYENGYIWEDIKDKVYSTVDNYFLSLSQAWEAAEVLIVRTAQLESRILEVPGVLDISNTTINGSANNLVLESSQIPVRGNVSANN